MTKITEGQLKELVDAASIVERETMRMRQILTTGAVPPGWRPAVRQLEISMRELAHVRRIAWDELHKVWRDQPGGRCG